MQEQRDNQRRKIVEKSLGTKVYKSLLKTHPAFKANQNNDGWTIYIYREENFIGCIHPRLID